MRLSVCIIAHNEETKLPRALQSVRFADEVIVVDCGSTDRTVEIAKDYGARVFSCPNKLNLNINKNYSFAQATSDFVFCLDADEVIPEATAAEISSIINGNPVETGFFLPRRNYFLGRWLKHGGQYPDWQLRLFRRGKGRFPERHIHERLQVDGSVGRLRHPFDHFPYESRDECQRKLNLYTSFEAVHLLENGLRPSPWRALQYLYWTPGQRFLRRYILKLGFFDGVPGLEAVKMDMQNFRLRYRKLCELSRSDVTPDRKT